ncbi:unnamed protein product [Prorocentrum cordatum]|uniref:Uncharacterized protein n=1 Tax=Prorocentrum cordatum TaxID=2364126 RepID=A0ABN9SKW1_9DINO|nr:unnamed protein product [Polarella glacialis]
MSKQLSRGAVLMGSGRNCHSLATTLFTQAPDESSGVIASPELLNVYGVLLQTACPSMLSSFGPAEAKQVVNSKRGQVSCKPFTLPPKSKAAPSVMHSCVRVRNTFIEVDEDAEEQDAPALRRSSSWPCMADRAAGAQAPTGPTRATGARGARGPGPAKARGAAAGGGAGVTGAACGRAEQAPKGSRRHVHPRIFRNLQRKKKSEEEQQHRQQQHQQ